MAYRIFNPILIEVDGEEQWCCPRCKEYEDNVVVLNCTSVTSHYELYECSDCGAYMQVS